MESYVIAVLISKLKVSLGQLLEITWAFNIEISTYCMYSNIIILHFYFENSSNCFCNFETGHHICWSVFRNHCVMTCMPTSKKCVLIFSVVYRDISPLKHGS